MYTLCFINGNSYLNNGKNPIGLSVQYNQSKSNPKLYHSFTVTKRQCLKRKRPKYQYLSSFTIKNVFYSFIC